MSTQIDRPTMEQKRLEATAVVASRVSRLHLAGVERRITKREVLIVIGFSVVLLLLVFWAHVQHDHDRQVARDQRSADRETIRTFSTQLQEQQGLIIGQAKESKQQLALINELRRKLIKLGVDPKSLPSLPSPIVATAFGGGATSGQSGSGHVAAGGRATPSPSRPSPSAPSSSSSAGRPNPTPTPTRGTPTPTPTRTHVPLIDIPTIQVGVIHLPSIQVG